MNLIIKNLVLTITAILILIITTTTTAIANNDSDNLFFYFSNVRAAVDKGINFKLENSAGDYNAKINSGYGLNFQYYAGLGFLKIYDRPVFSIGGLLDTSILYTEKSNIFSAALGVNVRMFYFFDLGLSKGYAYFSNNMPEFSKINEKESGQPNSELFFLQMGLSIPVQKRFDIFLQFVASMYSNDNKSYHWLRNSYRFGFSYIL